MTKGAVGTPSTSVILNKEDYYKNFSFKAPFFRYGDEKLIENQQLRTKKKW